MDESACYLPIHGRCRLDCAKTFDDLLEVWDALSRSGANRDDSDSAAELIDQLFLDLRLAQATINELQGRN